MACIYSPREVGHSGCSDAFTVPAGRHIASAGMILTHKGSDMSKVILRLSPHDIVGVPAMSEKHAVEYGSISRTSEPSALICAGTCIFSALPVYMGEIQPSVKTTSPISSHCCA